MAEGKKKIIIPDTNFIREHTYDLMDVLEVLKKHGEVFICEITIEERLAQERIEIKRDYTKIEEVKEKYKKIADINFKQSLEEKIRAREETLLRNYKNIIGNNIIESHKMKNYFLKY